MGQTSSHKHLRSDYAKGGGSGVHPGQHHSGIMSNSVYGSSVDYSNYNPDDINEDDEISYPTINSRHSYSPTHAIPMFKFPENREQNKIDIANRKIPVVFKYTNKNVKEVYLAGSFTNWKDKIPMIKSDGDFIIIVDLPEGEHQYKFYVDGKWEHDPNQTTIDDSFNGKNNVVSVKKSDFEVMDALECDSMQPGNNSKSSTSVDDLSKSPPGEYTDDIPIRGFNSISLDKPPYLPPQLLNIVLNKDTSAKCEPALLPEPNHVMLKHLYALSIRDGVMVLSSTFRFKQKFVTTCFYKPI